MPLIACRPRQPLFRARHGFGAAGRVDARAWFARRHPHASAAALDALAAAHLQLVAPRAGWPK